MRDSDPPACSAHARRASQAASPQRQQSVGRHASHAQALEQAEVADRARSAGEQSLEEEIASARLALRRILAILDRSRIGGLEPADQVPDQAPSLTPAEYARLASLALQAVRTVARLLRDERAISANAARDIPTVIAQALDHLGIDWGREL